MNNIKICPRCGKENRPNWQKCYYCGMNIYDVSPRNNVQPNMNPIPQQNLYKCQTCGLLISPAAERCPRCGEPVLKPDPNNGFIDGLCFLSIVAAYFLFFTSFWWLACLLSLGWTIIYQKWYSKYCDDPIYDASGLKRTRNICCGALILYSVTFVVVLL